MEMLLVLSVVLFMLILAFGDRSRAMAPQTAVFVQGRGYSPLGDLVVFLMIVGFLVIVVSNGCL